jgi:hypothetical protein
MDSPGNITIDGDGDGADFNNEEDDGDGFFDGDCDRAIADRLDQVETRSEDRIQASIDTEGLGLKLGVDGRFELTKKWSVVGSMAVSLMATDQVYRYRETFVSERDRYLNFIDWDFNGDGVYDNLDFDFDGSCGGVAFGCVPDLADESALPTTQDDRGVDRRFVDGSVTASGLFLLRAGAINSVANDTQGSGVTNNSAYQTNQLRVGDAVGESERNTDILRETRLLSDVAGDSSGLSSILDVTVGAEYRFSRFASLDFGYRTSRWFDAGRFRTLANDVIEGKTLEQAEGDFTIDGYYLRLTITPR